MCASGGGSPVVPVLLIKGMLTRRWTPRRIRVYPIQEEDVGLRLESRAVWVPLG